MSGLESIDKIIFERLFDRGGFVLNFTDRSYAEFFRENGININDSKYLFNGTSKMKRLRAFWEIEPDGIVGKILEKLLLYACTIEAVPDKDKASALVIIDRLLNRKSSRNNEATSETDFLDLHFEASDITKLNLDPDFKRIILHRIEEIQKSIKSQCPLSVIFLCGSTLEGLLLDLATKNAQKFNQSAAAPKDTNGTVKKIYDWLLKDLIDTAHELNYISLDIKKHGHSLRDFRNYIHPRAQAAQKFDPDMHTAKISWQVLQAAIANLLGERK
ncbi:hypothetical protein [Leptospira meyeri]|uniref:hypothetical protein n=1 Tax=Leptospira meyeri TaxID=29508 RepID=UPI001083B3C9|nr:hypothetical protein [Leptospira meyeri]TGL13509.1 hypothetical protein EHQ50_08490 [Leptospira meyeri]